MILKYILITFHSNRIESFILSPPFEKNVGGPPPPTSRLYDLQFASLRREWSIFDHNYLY